ncbi:MAG: PaaI family thioesterase [Dehalococcoidia bacterium]|nr:MAG: PaaI family thioesterase [Dehalococcoidia bacterium]
MMIEKNTKTARNISWLKEVEKEEPVASFLNMKLIDLTPGYAKVKMNLLHEYQNFHKSTFGGIIMALADQAFGYASNSLAYPSVASQFSTYFIARAKSGDELTAECRVLKSGKRAGISEVTIKNQDDKLIARATGVTISINYQD